MGNRFLHDAADLRLKAADVDAARIATGMLPITGSGRVTVDTDGRGGTALGHAERFERITDIRRVALVGGGPNGEDDGDNEVYWGQTLGAEAGEPTAPLVFFGDPNNYPDTYVIPVHNLAEWAEDGGTHTLATDGTVIVTAYAWTDDNGNTRYVFDRPPPAVAFKYGTLAVAWPEFADHNQVTLTPCVSETDDTPTGDADIVAFVQTPIDSTPYFFAVNVGQIVAYYTTAEGTNVLVHVPFPGGDTVYDLPQIITTVHGLGVGGVGPLRAQ